MMQLLMVGVFAFVSVTGGDVTTQKMDAYKLGTWENGDQLFWTGGKVDDQMELKTEVKEAGKYRLQVVLTKAPDYGIVQFALDGKKIGGKIDVYSSWITNTPPIPLGDVELTAGEHKLTMTIVGKNKKSKGTNIGIDRVVLTKVPELSPALPGANLTQLGELASLPMLSQPRTGQQAIMFSSYDRTGGNNDGFRGDYSRLWGEDGGNVMAVMEGPGVIERIWFPYNCWKPGSMLRIYLDGNEKPAVEVPIEDIFSGKRPQFPKPIVGKNQGGYYCYVPIPYRNGCKVVLDDPKLKFYQVTCTKLDPSLVNGVATFSMDMGDTQKMLLARAVKLWSNLGDPNAIGLEGAKWTDVELNLKPGEEKKIDLPAGAQTVRAVMLDGDKKQLKTDRTARFEFRWDGAENPAVDLSAEFFFCQAESKKNIRTLLTGATDTGWYNFMPMPYIHKGSLVVRATDKPVTGKLRIATVAASLNRDKGMIGYLHAAYNESIPTKPKVHHPFLERKGTGHYIGTYMVTRGQFKTDKGTYIPLWLEGDEKFTVDGELVIHGTGSEDYFNCGWYAVRGRLNGPGGMPTHGFPVYRFEGKGEKTESLANAYRWHVGDPVPYTKEIDAKIEHGPVNKTKANYRSSAFYYEMTP